MIKAKYTVVLKTLLDEPEVKALIDKAMSTYPLYEKRSKEEFIPSIVPTRSELNQKILDYYKYREIGFETVGRFIDELEIALREIMPYYNQLLFTLDQDYNILYNVDYDKEVHTKREGTATNENQTTTESQSESTSNETNQSQSTQHSEGSDSSHSDTSMSDQKKVVHADTPQGVLGIPKENINGVTYADTVQWEDNAGGSETDTNGATETDSTGSSSGSSASTSSGSISGNTNQNGEENREETEEMHERIFGNYGQMSYQYLVAKYRELILNVEQRIINDRRIQELFMLVY